MTIFPSYNNDLPILKLKTQADSINTKKVSLIGMPGDRDLQIGDTFFLQFRDVGMERIRSSITHLKPASSPLLSLINGAKPFPHEYSFDAGIKTPNNTLNPKQQVAYQAVMTQENPIVLIRGPPGTGKTRIIAEIARRCGADENFRFIVCSQANEIIDEIVTKIDFMGDKLLRYQSRSHEANFPNIPHGVKAAALKITGNHARSEDIEREKVRLLNKAQIICTTLGAIDFVKFLGIKRFDIMVVDEAGQANELEVLQALALFPKKLVLIGDDRQLRPFCDRDSETSSSMFTRLFQAGYPFVELDEQYRMCFENCSLISQIFYDNKLKTSGGKLKARGAPGKRPWDKRLCFVHSDGEESKETDTNFQETSYKNDDQVEKIFNIVEELLRNGLTDLKQVSILTPYVAQKRVI